jgi:hypothetical protein
MIISLEKKLGKIGDPYGEACNQIFFDIWNTEFPKLNQKEFFKCAETNLPCIINTDNQTIEIEESVYTMLVLKYL